jgi:hypothetical protein
MHVGCVFLFNVWKLDPGLNYMLTSDYTLDPVLKLLQAFGLDTTRISLQIAMPTNFGT